MCVVSALDESVHHISEAFARLIGQAVVAYVVQSDACIIGHFHAALYSDVVVEHVIDAESCGKVVLYMVCNLVGSIAVASAVLALVGRLIGRVVGCLALEEVSASVFTVP